jgi:quercetin dioxygenase-like cupin family protein
MIAARIRIAIAAAAMVAACGRPTAPVPPRAIAVEPAGQATPSAEPTPASEDERLAAIQKAMNELDEAAQQCWAAAATERFDIEGELALQIDIAAATSQVAIVRDTVHNAALVDCVQRLLAHYRWAPPLYGQAIQLPFKFRAPDGQNTIDRELVAWHGQAQISVAVLLDETNSGNDAASMFELAIAAGATTGLRATERAELWYFLGAGRVSWVDRGAHIKTPHDVAAGDMLYVPRGAAREVASTTGDLHAVIVCVPGGREGAARAGALPTREVTAAAGGPVPVVLPAQAARTYGAATIYADASTIHDPALAASILALPAGGKVPEHVHAGETELLYVLAGGGTMTVAGIELAVGPTSVVQIPSNTRHAFTATSDVRAVQIYTPGGPEQRFKARK